MAFSATPGRLSRPTRSPMTKISGWPGTDRSASTAMRPAWSDVASSTSARRRAKGTASTPAVHKTVRTGKLSGGPPALGVTVTPSYRTSVTCTPMCCSTPEMVQDLGGLAGQGRGEAAENARPAVEQQDTCILRLDAVEFVGQGPGRHLADLSGQLDTRGSATGDG